MRDYKLKQLPEHHHRVGRYFIIVQMRQNEKDFVEYLKHSGEIPKTVHLTVEIKLVLEQKLL